MERTIISGIQEDASGKPKLWVVVDFRKLND